MNKCIAIFGPTASGKSSLALALARELNSVIISVDSMQIYKGMDIGTAKPTKKERELVPHFMIDICEPNENYSVYEFKNEAEKIIRSLHKRGITPILVGGTGLYFDALFHNTNFGEFVIKENVQKDLQTRLEACGSETLLKELQEVDPETAEHLHSKDHKRIIRGLEVYYSTGKTLTEFKAESKLQKSDFSFLKIHLVYKNRDNLYRRINQRVDAMVEEGLISEAKKIFDDTFTNCKTASQAIGYKELVPYFLGDRNLDDCLETLKQKTRNYAKRQITWFKRYNDAYELIMDQEPPIYPIARDICKQFLEEDVK